MRPILTFLTLFLFLFSFLVLMTSNPVHAVEAVASVKNVKGPVDVQRRNSTIAAKTGLILNDKDLVITHDKSRITIIFRDGSVIRLFPNTKFLIEKSDEASGGPRRFLHNFRLKLGSFWGKFTRHYQETAIVTPTATVGIKGTTVALVERNDRLDVALSTGAVLITNQAESVELEAGHIAEKITQRDLIKNKIRRLPFQIVIKTDRQRISVPAQGDEKELYFTLQMIDVKTNENVNRSGQVYVSAAIDHLVFDQDIRLNTRGYARIKATLLAPKNVENAPHQAEIFALMDGEEYLDVRAGSTVLLLDDPTTQNQKLKIDARTGKLKK